MAEDKYLKNRQLAYDLLKKEGYTDIGESAEKLFENRSNGELAFKLLKEAGYEDLGDDYVALFYGDGDKSSATATKGAEEVQKEAERVSRDALAAEEAKTQRAERTRLATEGRAMFDEMRRGRGVQTLGERVEAQNAVPAPKKSAQAPTSSVSEHLERQNEDVRRFGTGNEAYSADDAARYGKEYESIIAENEALGEEIERYNKTGQGNYTSLSERQRSLRQRTEELMSSPAGKEYKDLLDRYNTLKDVSDTPEIVKEKNRIATLLSRNPIARAMMGDDAPSESQIRFTENRAEAQDIETQMETADRAKRKELKKRLKEVNKELLDNEYYQEDVAKRKQETQAQLDDVLSKMSAIEKRYLAQGKPESAVLDPDYRELNVAAQDYAKTLRQMGHIQEKNANNFWVNFADVFTDLNTYTFGMAGLDRVFATKTAVENPDEVGSQEVLSAVSGQNALQQEIGQFIDSKGRWGSIAGNSIPFAAQIALTGGGGNVANYVSQGVKSKLGRNLFTRVLGAGLGDIAAGFTMANTIGAGKTLTDILDRYYGTLVADGEGGYGYEGGTNLAEAIWKGEAGNTIEFASERAGEHLSRLIGKGILGKAINAAQKNGGKINPAVEELAKTMNVYLKDFNYRSSNQASANWMQKAMGGFFKVSNMAGVQGYPFEVMEEYIGLIGNILVGGEEDWMDFSKLGDKETHADIWGGMLYSIGVSQGGAIALGTGGLAYSGIKKARLYHKLESALAADSASALELLGDEEWTRIKTEIDGTTNEELAKKVTEYMDNPAYDAKQREAVLDYVKNTYIFRGFNAGTLVQAKERLTGEPGLMSLDINAEAASAQDQVSDAYMLGYNLSTNGASEEELDEMDSRRRRTAVDANAQMDDIDAAVEKQRAYLEKLTGVSNMSEQDASVLLNDQSVDQKTRDAALDYLMGLAVKRGFLDGEQNRKLQKMAQFQAMLEKQYGGAFYHENAFGDRDVETAFRNNPSTGQPEGIFITGDPNSAGEVPFISQDGKSRGFVRRDDVFDMDADGYVSPGMTNVVPLNDYLEEMYRSYESEREMEVEQEDEAITAEREATESAENNKNSRGIVEGMEDEDGALTYNGKRGRLIRKTDMGAVFEPEDGSDNVELTWEQLANGTEMPAAEEPAPEPAPAEVPAETHAEEPAEEAPKIPLDKDGNPIYDAPGVSVEDALADMYTTEGLDEADVDEYIINRAAEAEKGRAVKQGKMSLKEWGQKKKEANRVADFWGELAKFANENKAAREKEEKEEAARQELIKTYGVDTSNFDLTPQTAEEAVAEYLGRSEKLINLDDAVRETLGKRKDNRIPTELFRHLGAHGILTKDGGRSIADVARDIVGEYEGTIAISEDDVRDAIIDALTNKTKSEIRETIFNNRLQRAQDEADLLEEPMEEEYGPVIRTFKTKGGLVEVRTKTTEKDGVKTTKVVAIRNGSEVATRGPQTTMPVPEGYTTADVSEVVVGITELRESADGTKAATALVKLEDGTYSEMETKLVETQTETEPVKAEEPAPEPEPEAPVEEPAEETTEELPEEEPVPEAPTVEEPAAEPRVEEQVDEKPSATVKEVDVNGLLGAIGDMQKGKRSEVKVSEFAKPVEEKPAEQSVPTYGSNNKVVSQERYEELKKQMLDKLKGQLNAGFDPEIFSIGVQMAAFHIEAGARAFVDFTKRMIADLGDAIRPYLKGIYNGARDLPGMEEYKPQMDSAQDVERIDVNDLDKVEEIEENSSESPEKSVNLEGEEEAREKFTDTVANRLIAAIASGERPFKSITDLRRAAREAGMEVDERGATDILLQELAEVAIVRAARKFMSDFNEGLRSRNAFNAICKLYEMQPTISMRSSQRVAMQQYSTPLPMSFVAQMFAYKAGMQDVLEPTAGNGMLVFGIPADKVHANELDETRKANLDKQGFREVTQNDATEPFTGDYDAVVANPPFGSHDAVQFDGKSISGLDPIITLRALDAMKDDGRAAIIVGGNVEWADNGSWKTKKAFFSYLYDHYNVKGVVNMGGQLYNKQGTNYPTMMILIDGRRSEAERAASTVYPPVRDKARGIATTNDELFDLVTDILNDKRKTDGNEVVRAERERKPADRVGQTGSLFAGDDSTESPENGTDGGRGENGGGGVQSPRRNDVAGENRQDETVEGRPDGERPGSVRDVPAEGPGEVAERSADSGDSRVQGDSGRGKSDRRGSGDVPLGDAGREQSESVSGGEPAVREPVRVARKIKDKILSYIHHSRARSLESVAPAAMVEDMDASIQKIERELGRTIDDFVTEELGYNSTAELHKALAAEQIDSVAMAIYQMKKGKAMIIGDQTGVGKGRQVAALIRWANRQGKKPVFMTQKAGLFSDIYRDLRDIGSGGLNPLILNSAEMETDKETGEKHWKDTAGVMLDEEGNLKYQSPGKAALDKIIENGKVPDGYDFVVLTYSQLNNGDQQSRTESKKKIKDGANPKGFAKAAFVRQVVNDNYIILDESHTAAGEGSNSGAFLRSVMPSVKGVTFSSATFAKRPDTMPLYAIKSAMSEANVEPNKLIAMIKKGGVTLQEIMSRALTRSGQMVRRERDMSDVKTDWKTVDDPATAKKARANYDRAIEIFNKIIQFQRNFITPAIDDISRDLAEMASSAGETSGTKNFGVDNPPFVSQTYNFTKQLMLALKAEAIVDEVLKEIKAGRHPVIALENTYESGLDAYAVGDKIDDTSFSAGLLRSLGRILQYTVTDPDGNKSQEFLTPEELGPEAAKQYYALQDEIREATKGIFLSPLDLIKERLTGMGYNVGEVTGRKTHVVKEDDGYYRRERVADAKQAVRDFNSGASDVIIINKSGSTGISLHSSVAFKDQRPRSMIIAQPLGDINDYMQMIGRIDRTGQVHRGYYINLSLPVPAELRFNMMLASKLKSLNANTTTSQESETSSVEAPDFLNKYGSQVVIEYLRDNPDVFSKLVETGMKLGNKQNAVTTISELENYRAMDEDVQKVTGRIALLPVEEQEKFYADISERYNTLIKYLDETGENTLKITTLPLKAKTLARRVGTEGKDPGGNNPFAQNSYVERVDVDVLRKPMKADEIRKVRETLTGGKEFSEYRDGLVSRVNEQEKAGLAAEEERYNREKEKTQKEIDKQVSALEAKVKNMDEVTRKAEANRITNRLMANLEEKHQSNVASIKSMHRKLREKFEQFNTDDTYLVYEELEGGNLLEEGNAYSPALFCGFKIAKAGENVTPSTSVAVFATLDGRRRLEIKFTSDAILDEISNFTNTNYWTAKDTTIDNWDSSISNASREERYILTGNILQAWDDATKEGILPGRLVSYTDIDGNIHDGILMNQSWKPTQLRSSGAPINSRTEQILKGETVKSTDGEVEIEHEWGDTFSIYVPKTKKAGAKYFENEDILSLIFRRQGFHQHRGRFTATVLRDNMRALLNILGNMGVRVNTGENESAWEEVGQETTAKNEAQDEGGTYFRSAENLNNPIDRAAAITKINDISKKLGITFKEDRSLKAKGEFNAKTNEIRINIDAHKNTADIEATLLHEAVAHYGLRKLFGDEWKALRQQLYKQAAPEIKARVDAIAKKYGLSSEVALEEYLAQIAEDGWFDRKEETFWQKVINAIKRMFSKIGIDAGYLTEADLSSMLFASYRNLQTGGALETAARVATAAALRRVAEASHEEEDNGPEDDGPGGTPTNDRTTSAEFKEFFGDWQNDPDNASKVVDENGRPKLVAHGSRTAAEFSVFDYDADTEKARGSGKTPAFFFTDMDKANVYARNGLSRGRVIPAYLSIKKPAEIDYEGARYDGMGIIAKVWDRKKREWVPITNNKDGKNLKYFATERDAVNEYARLNPGASYVRVGEDILLTREYDAKPDIGEFVDGIDRNVNDGAIVKNIYEVNDTIDDYVVFSSNQIKSPDAKAFNAEDPDIYQRELSDLPDDIRKDVEDLETDQETEVLYRRASNSATAQTAAEMYGDKVRTIGSAVKEVLVDEMAPVDTLMDALAAESGTKIKDDERVSDMIRETGGKAMQAVREYDKKFLQPMWSAVGEFRKNTGSSIKDTETYIGLKSGLERNVVLAKRDAKRDYQAEYDAEIDEINQEEKTKKKALDKQLQNGKISDVTYAGELTLLQQEMQQKRDDAELRRKGHFADVDAGTDERFLEYRKKDYSAITAWAETEDLQEAERLAGDYVNDMESRAGKDATKEVWKRINAATKETLKFQYDHQILSRQQYQDISKMMEYYVPMRGFSEDTAEDLYYYYVTPQSNDFQATVLAAKGRTTWYEGPLGNIGAMHSSAISQGVKNDAKLALLDAVRRRPKNTIATVTRAWFVKNGQKDANGKDQYDVAYPQIPEGATLAQRESIIEQFEQDMAQKKAAGDAYNSHREVDLHGGVVAFERQAHMNEHIVKVREGGKEYGIIINGNPAAAQAINGVKRGPGVGNKILDGMRRWTRVLSSMFTTFSVPFWVSNFQRDHGQGLTNAFIRNNPGYVGRYIVNRVKAAKLFPLILGSETMEKALANGDPVAQYYKQYLDNGGPMGQNRIEDNEYFERKMRRYIDNSAKQGVIKGANAVLDFIGGVGEAIETITRFAVFMTSMESGRPVHQSISDAKEISTNFARKGSGRGFTRDEIKRMKHADGTDLKPIERVLVSTISWSVELCRATIPFFNAAVQGLENKARNYREHLGKTLIADAIYFALGFGMQMFFRGGGGDDDKEKYSHTSDYIRRNNILNPVFGNGTYIKWALPQEYRFYYALGDIFAGYVYDMRPADDAIADAVGSLMQLSPVGVVTDEVLYSGGDKQTAWENIVLGISPGVTDPLFESLFNRDFKGARLYNQGFNENRKMYPGWTKAIETTGNEYVWAMEQMNKVHILDKDDKGKRHLVWIADDKQNAERRGTFNFNPAVVEHLAESYFSGPYQIVVRTPEAIGKAIKGEAKTRDIPLWNRIVLNTNDNKRDAYYSNMYYYFKEYADEAGRLFSDYSKTSPEHRDEVKQSTDYKYHLVFEKYKDTESRIKKQKNLSQNKGDLDKVHQYDNMLDDIRYQIARECLDIYFNRNGRGEVK